MRGYPIRLALPAKTVRSLTSLIVASAPSRGRPRTLPAEQQAVATLMVLRHGLTFAQVAFGFGIGLATAHRYVGNGVDLLAGKARSLRAGLRGRHGRGGVLIIDGTLLPCDRRWHPKGTTPPNYSGKHHRPGLNVQAVANGRGDLVWLSPPLPGNTHDLTAARHHGIIGALRRRHAAADKAYTGAGPQVHVAKKGRGLTRLEKKINTSLNQLRAPGERVFAQLKQWRFCHRIRVSPNHAHRYLAAIATCIYQQQ